MITPRTVLVVEPDDDDRGGFANTLRSTGLTVDSAPDSARALAGIASGQHAIIVVDPVTPGLNTGALMDALRKTSPHPVTLVICDGVGPDRDFGADVIHGYVRRGDEQLTNLIGDCLAALRETTVGLALNLSASAVIQRPN